MPSVFTEMDNLTSFFLLFLLVRVCAVPATLSAL